MIFHFSLFYWFFPISSTFPFSNFIDKSFIHEESVSTMTQLLVYNYKQFFITQLVLFLTISTQLFLCVDPLLNLWLNQFESICWYLERERCKGADLTHSNYWSSVIDLGKVRFLTLSTAKQWLLLLLLSTMNGSDRLWGILNKDAVLDKNCKYHTCRMLDVLALLSKLS